MGGLNAFVLPEISFVIFWLTADMGLTGGQDDLVSCICNKAEFMFLHVC
jgi:hypothetical protein